MRGNSSASGGGLLWLRVALLLAGIAAGLWLSFAPAAGMYQVRPMDRAAFRALQPSTVPADGAAPWVMPADEAWQTLAANLWKNVNGDSRDLLPHLSTALGLNDFYFPVGKSPLPAIPAPPRAGAWPLYVQVVPVGHVYYLQVAHLDRGVGLRHMPSHLAYPLRPYALWAFVAGIAAFVFLPHHYYRWPSIRRAELIVGLVTIGGLAAIWFLPPELPRPLESKRPDITPEAVARQEEIAKDIAALQKQMRQALPELEKGTLDQRKAKLEAYKILVARHAKLSEELLDPDAPATRPEK